MTCEKRTFNTIAEATEAAKGLHKDKKVEHLHAYLCPHCTKFHLASKRMKNKKRIYPEIITPLKQVETDHKILPVKDLVNTTATYTIDLSKLKL